MRLLLASRNAKKLAELRRILEPVVPGIEVIGLDDVEAYDEVPETGATFEANALIKAREGFERTGLSTVADDSGLTVEALNGMPGVLSARWAGRHGDDEANRAPRPQPGRRRPRRPARARRSSARWPTSTPGVRS